MSSRLAPYTGAATQGGGVGTDYTCAAVRLCEAPSRARFFAEPRPTLSADPRSDVQPAAPSGTARQAGERALKNTIVRAIGEIVGKLASLVVFALLARKVGAAHLGTYVFALVWGEVSMVPVGLGIDRYLLRRVAADHSRLDDLFFNALALKVARGAPIVGLTVGAVFVLGFDAERQAAVCLLTLGMFADTLARTPASTFNAFERGELLAATIVIQRFSAAAFAVAALAAGYGVVAVSLAFLLGALVRVAFSLRLLKRRIRMPARAFPRAPRRELRSRSLPFTAQDLFGLVIARADVLLLSALATTTVVGLYGAAYRLLDATAFIGVSLGSAFMAMYTYLGEDTVPTIRSVFERSIKLCLLALVPIGVTCGMLAEPLCRTLFGRGLVAAAPPLRLLAPVVVMMGVVALTTGLITSRINPRGLLVGVAGVAVTNLVLNLTLIPPLGAIGAALAMLVSAAVFVAFTLVISVRVVGGLDWLSTLAAPLGAGLMMATAIALVPSPLALAVAAGGVVYLVAYAALERAVSPRDFDFAISTITRRLPRRRSAPV